MEQKSGKNESFVIFQSLDIQLSGLVDVYQDRRAGAAAVGPSGDFAVRFTRVLMRFIKEMEVLLHAFAASVGCNICKRAFLL